MTKNNVIYNKNKIVQFLSIFIIGLLFILSIDNNAMAANGSYIDQSTPYTGGGCYMQVYNTRTGKYYTGIYNSDWDSNIVVDGSDFRHDDVLECDAYTLYAYGSYWVYKGDSYATLLRDKYYKASDRYTDHLTFTVRVTSKVTKISCSASYNSTLGEELSVTIYSASDNIIPTVSLTSEGPDNSKVLINHDITITGTDNIKVKGWKVTSDSVKSPEGFTDFEGEADVTKSYVYSCPTAGFYYAWVIDIYGNVSDYASFTVGTSPVGTISAPAVSVGESVRFTVSVSSGTTPYTYQWYIGAPTAARRNSTYDEWNVNGENPDIYKIDGATSSYYNYVATQNDYNKYVLCAINNGYDIVFISEKMSINFAPQVKALVSPSVEDSTTGVETAHVKKGGKATLTATITVHGDPDVYSYQWYSASTLTGAGSVVPGATRDTYEVIARTTQTVYYFCRVNNGKYAESNRVCVRSDVTEPTINIGEFNDNIYVNENVEFDIPLVITSTGYGFDKDNFDESDIKILVRENGAVATEITPEIKKLSFEPSNSSNVDFNYTLKLKGLKENGILSLMILEDSFEDEFGNGNAKTEIITDIKVDNVDPVIKFSSILGGVEVDPRTTDNYYLTSNDTDLVIELYVEEEVGYDINEFNAADVAIKVGTNVLTSGFSRSLHFSEKDGSRYYYRLTLSRIPGNGQLYVYVNAGNVVDKATNGNATKNPNEKEIEVSRIIIDNTKPSIDSIRMNIGSASGPEYPGSLDSWHQGWSNDNVYITVNASDTSGIDYYMVSRDNKVSFSKLANSRDHVDNDFNGTIYYRVYDKAGNMEESSCNVKVDKTAPVATKVLLHEERPTGSIYVFNSDKPTNKSIYTTADTPKDVGNTQSGILDIKVNDSIYMRYEISKFNSIIDREPDTDFGVKVIGFNSGPVLLSGDGYYEMKSYTYDLAGNSTVSEVYKLLIKKRTNNVIKLRNLNDVGSGVDRAEIFIYEGFSPDPTREVKHLEVEELYKDYTTSVTLNKGNYYIRVILYDKVGNNSFKEKVINNNL